MEDIELIERKKNEYLNENHQIEEDSEDEVLTLFRKALCNIRQGPIATARICPVKPIKQREYVVFIFLRFLS